MSKRPPKDATLNLRTPRPLRERITRQATAKGMKLSDVAREAMTLGLDILDEQTAARRDGQAA